MKKVLYILLCVIIASSLFGCNKETNKDNIEQENNLEANQLNIIERKVTDVEGKFVGGIDRRSVEIIVDDAPSAFRVQEDFSEKFNDLDSGQRVRISYVERREKSEDGELKFLILKDIAAIEKQQSDLPKTKKLKVSLEGMVEERKATLYESKYGYYIYIIDGFLLKETDTGKSYITMEYDPEFYAEIILQDKDFNIDEWEQTAKKTLEKFGEIQVMEPTEHFDPYFHDANKYMIASAPNKGSIIIMLDEVEGKAIQYKINMPIKEAAEGAGPLLWTMIKTIQIK